MKVIGVVSQKGGVGKTTVALNTAFALARRGHRVLLADTDPQGGVGLSLQGMKTGPGLAGYVARELTLDAVMMRTRLSELHLLPVGNLAIQATHAFASRLADGKALRRLVAEATPRFDVLLLDTPSGFTGATLGVMRVAHSVISPLQSEPLALRSAAQLLEVIGALREEGAQVTLGGFLLTMVDRGDAESAGVALEAATELPEAAVLKTTVPRDPVFLQASGAGVPVGLLRRQAPPAAALFDQAATELEHRVGLATDETDDGPIPLLT